MKYAGYLKWAIAFAVLLSGLLPVLAQDSLTITEIERAKLTADTPAAAARFGVSIAADGDTVVVGAPRAQVGSGRTGAAYVFVRQGESWLQAARLIASDGEDGDLFGASVAIDGSTIAVSASADDEAGGNAGAVYIFMNSGSGWTQTGKLLPSAAGDVRFGFSIAINRDVIAVGTPYTGSGLVNSGAVYIFEAVDGSWMEIKRMATGRDGAVLNDLYGWSVALGGDVLVVGAYLDDTAYIYSRTSDWQQTDVLRGSITRSRDRFGYAVATDGNHIIVGATHDSSVGNNAGTAFVFVLESGSWLQQSHLIPSWPFPLNGTNFGWSVAIADGMAVVGAANSKGAIDAEESGMAYVYQLNNGIWREIALLSASDANAFDHLGVSVAISSDSILVGAPDSDGDEADTGAVYIMADFHMPSP